MKAFVQKLDKIDRRENKMFQPKYITFLYIGEYLFSIKNDRFKDEIAAHKKMWKTIMVSLDDLKRPIKNRLFCIYPAAMLVDQFNDINNFQCCYGVYYNPKDLYLMDDVVLWSHYRINYDQIRTAKTINQEYLSESRN